MGLQGISWSFRSVIESVSGDSEGNRRIHERSIGFQGAFEGDLGGFKECVVEFKNLVWF